MKARIDLGDFLRSGGVADPLIHVLSTAAAAGVTISRELARAHLSGETGFTGGTNVQGEAVKKMDSVANEILVEAFREARNAALVASEEMAEPLVLSPTAPYSVLFDPLDGSSNVDTGGCVGSIVSVQRRPAEGGTAKESLLQKGARQAAACYLNYGPATALVLSTGTGSHLFGLDPDTRRFVLTTASLRMPPRGKTYAANEGQKCYYRPATRRLLEHLQALDKAEGRPYSTRYSGCLVTDVHRLLMEGGIYFYPADLRDPKKPHGKLRLVYECAPLAMIVEQAGGRASTGKEPILEVQPTEIHQRVPIYIGSLHEVALAERFEAEAGQS